MASRREPFSNPTNFKPFQRWLLDDWEAPTFDASGFLAGLQLASQTKPAASRLPTVPQIKATPAGPPHHKDEPGALGRIFGALDAPQNAVMNTIQAFTTDNPNKSGAGEFLSDLGATGKAAVGMGIQIQPFNWVPGLYNIGEGVEKVVPGLDHVDETADKLNPANSVSKQLARIDYFKEHGIQREVLGLLGDIATDPLTYVPFVGWGKAAGRLGRPASKMLEEVAADAGKVQPEEWLPRAARGENPNFKPPSKYMDISDTERAKDPNLADEVINPKPATEHLHDARREVSTDEGLAQYGTPEVSARASAPMGQKVKHEMDMLNDANLDSKFKPPTGEQGAQVAEEVARGMKTYSGAVQAGEIAFQDAASQVIGGVAARSWTAAQEIFKSAKSGKTNYKKAVEYVAQRVKAAEDHLVERAQQFPEGHPERMPLAFAGHDAKLSHALGHAEVPKNKTESSHIEELIRQFIDPSEGITHPALVKVVNQARATEVMKRPEWVQEFLSRSNTLTDQAIDRHGVEALTPEVQRSVLRRAVYDTTKNAAMRGPRAGRTPAQVNADAHAFAKEVADHVTDVPATKMHKLYVKSAEASAKGKASTRTIDAESERIGEDLGAPLKDQVDHNGLPINATPGMLDRLGGWMQWAGENLTTWYGKYGLDRMFKSNIQGAVASAVRRHNAARAILKKYDEGTISAAMRVLQQGPEADLASLPPELRAAVDDMQGWADRLFGKVAPGKAGHNTLTQMGFSQRSNMLMEDINKELNRMWGTETTKFRFFDGIYKDKNGKVWNFNSPEEGGLGWWNSWMAWDLDKMPKHRINNPVHMLHDMDLGMERRARLYTTLEDAGARFGRTFPSGEFVHQVSHTKGGIHPMLEGRYFPKEVAEGLQNVIKHYEKGSWVPKSAFGRTMIKLLRAWKSGVTIYNPSHHIRNFIGDMWMTWMAGHNDPTDFYRAMKVMRANKGNYKAAIKDGSWEAIDNLGNPAAQALDAGVNSVIIRGGKGYGDITAHQIHNEMHKKGLLPEIDDLEDTKTEGMDRLFENAQIFGGRVRGFATKIAEYREHTVRTHHYIAALRKELKAGKSFDEASEYAAAEVRKWHPDGTDLSHWEQRYARNVIPFYSWTRKAIPLIMEGLARNPAKIVAYPRLMMSASAAMGLQDQNLGHDLTDPFPPQHMYASWIKEAGIGPMGLYGAGGLSGLIGGLGEPGYDENTQARFGTTIIDPSNPFDDLVSQIYGGGGMTAPFGAAIAMANPALRGAFEIGTGKTTTGSPIEGVTGPYGGANYILSQIPPTATAQRIFPGLNPLDTPKKQKTGGFSMEGFLNWLTAAGVQGSGQYRGKARLEEKARLSK